MDETNDNPQRLLALMNRLRPLLMASVIRQFRSMQLSPSHGQVLGALWHTSPLAMKEVADHLGLTPPSITAITRHLVESGLVARRPHAADSRVALLELTEAGHALHHRLRAESLREMEQLLSALSPEEQQTFLDLLERVVGAGGCGEHWKRHSAERPIEPDPM
jgi:DNA-binding MarR family transcriptional regulator